MGFVPLCHRSHILDFISICILDPFILRRNHWDPTDSDENWITLYYYGQYEMYSSYDNTMTHMQRFWIFLCFSGLVHIL